VDAIAEVPSWLQGFPADLAYTPRDQQSPDRDGRGHRLRLCDGPTTEWISLEDIQHKRGLLLPDFLQTMGLFRELQLVPCWICKVVGAWTLSKSRSEVFTYRCKG
jgi:hypothetical protein